VGDGIYKNDTASYEYAFNTDDSSSYNTLYPKSLEVGYGLIDVQASVDKAIQYKKERTRDNENDLPTPNNLLANIKDGWNFLGTSHEVADLSIFSEVEIVWCLINGKWKAYSKNLAYAKALRAQDKLLLAIPKNTGLWVFKNAG
jgi:hypothetical protein